LKGRIVAHLHATTVQDISIEHLQGFSKLLACEDPPVLYVRHNDLIQYVLKRSRSKTEAYNLQKLFFCTPWSHCTRLLQHSTDVMLMNYVMPYLHNPPIKSLRCFLASHQAQRAVINCEGLLKSIVFQCIALLVELQQHKMEFAHNDFKSDNIMLERTPMSCMMLRDTRFYCWGVRVVLIDAETISGAIYKSSPLVGKMSKSSKASFGLDFPYSPYTDLHLLLMEIVYACKRLRPEWGPAFVKFLEEDAIPCQYFGDPYVTKENRLNGIGRIALKQTDRKLEDMLHSSYFEELLLR